MDTKSILRFYSFLIRLFGNDKTMEIVNVTILKLSWKNIDNCVHSCIMAALNLWNIILLSLNSILTTPLILWSVELVLHQFVISLYHALYTNDYAGCTDDHQFTEFSPYTIDNDKERKQTILHHWTRKINNYFKDKKLRKRIGLIWITYVLLKSGMYL